MSGRLHPWIAISLLVVSGACHNGRAPHSSALLTVKEARDLPPRQLADRLIGPALGSRIIEAERRYYDASTAIPQEVDLLSQPELAYPRVNGICSTDVITIEYNWFDYDRVDDTTPLRIGHVEGASRYKSFKVPPGEPGTPANEQAQEKACAAMKTAADAFRAPSAGDAQWLVAIEQEYRQVDTGRRYSFSCDDFADKSCRRAQAALHDLALNRATDVRTVDCPGNRSGDQVNYCYKLSFPYANIAEPEWELMVEGGMRDGMAPVEIRSLHLRHWPKPMPIS